MTDSLRDVLVDAWARQVETGFVLGDPAAPVETRTAFDPDTGVTFRFRWLPHRELRTIPHSLEQLGILDPDRDESRLFRDERDESGRHCFLCPRNVAISHPAEELVPITAGGRDWLAGANFAWLAQNHFTVMTERHVDQLYCRDVLETMIGIHMRTGQQFRVVFNGAHAGATIPWHLHLHITTDPMPVESLGAGRQDAYPTPLRVFPTSAADLDAVDSHVTTWERQDPRHHRVNLLVGTRHEEPAVFVFLRDTRCAVATNKGLMGGWEVAGDFAYSEPERRSDFETADMDTVRSSLAQIRPLSLRSER